MALMDINHCLSSLRRAKISLSALCAFEEIDIYKTDLALPLCEDLDICVTNICVG